MGEAAPNLRDHIVKASEQVLGANFGLDTRTLVDPGKLVATDQSMVIPLPQRESRQTSNNEELRSSKMVTLDVDPATVTFGSVHDYNAQQSVRAKYPYFSFEVNTSQILGNGVVAPTSQSRLRACLRALQKAWDKAPPLTASDLGVVQGKIYDLEKVKVAIPDELGTEKKVTRSNLLKINDVMDKLYASLITENHPIAQLDRYLQETYPDLTSAALQELRAALTIAVAHEEIETSYLEKIRSMVQALRQAQQPASA